jgi:O-antigen/teichoic acid export membrane protein
VNTPRPRDSAARSQPTVVRSVGPIGSVSASTAELGRGEDRNRRALLGSGAALGARTITLAATLLTVPLALTYLGAERYGMWLTISSMVALLSFADLGLGYGLLNSVTRSLATSDTTLARRQISSGFWVLAAVAFGLAVVGLAVIPVVPWERVFAVTSELAVAEARPAVAAFLAIFLVGLPLSVATQVRVARQEVYVVHLAAAIGSVTSIVAIVAVIAARGGVPALVVAMAAPPAVAVAVNGIWLFRRNAPELAPSRRLAELGIGWLLMRSGFLFLVLQMSVVVAFATDTLVLAQIVGPDAVAQYGVALRLFEVPLGLVAIATTPLWPAYGEAIARGDLAWVTTTLRRSIVVAVLVSVPAASILVVFGDRISAAWVGSAVFLPLSLLLAFGLWAIQRSIGHAVSMFLNGANQIRLQAIAATVMAIANIGLSIWLTARIGVAGVVWGTAISYGFLVLVPMAVYVPRVLQRIGARASVPTH